MTEKHCSLDAIYVYLNLQNGSKYIAVEMEQLKYREYKMTICGNSSSFKHHNDPVRSDNMNSGSKVSTYHGLTLLFMAWR